MLDYQIAEKNKQAKIEVMQRDESPTDEMCKAKNKLKFTNEELDQVEFSLNYFKSRQSTRIEDSKLARSPKALDFIMDV